MKIILAKLKFTNFKNFREKTIRFNQEVTNIFGQNNAGKTTLFDGFLWLLFGKDSTDRKDFEIKTLDENYEAFHRLEHEVEGTFYIDGVETVLRRALREKWTKKKGATKDEFTGHETTYFWNDVPLKLEDYQAKVSGLMNEQLFKLLTNTNYYNGLKWQERRNILLAIAGSIDDVVILDKIATVDNKAAIALLTNALNQKKSIKEFELEIGAKKKKIRDEKELLPSRIQEAHLALPEAENYDLILSNINVVKNDIDTVETFLNTKSEAAKAYQNQITEYIKQRGVISSNMLSIEHKEKDNVQQKKLTREQFIGEKRRLVTTKTDEVARLRLSYNNETARSNKLVAEKAALAEKHELVNAESLNFKEGEFACPACKRALEESDIDAKKTELINNFNKSKSERLNEIVTIGVCLANEIEAIRVSLGNITAKGNTLNAEITVLNNEIAELQTEHERLCNTEAEQAIEALANNTAFQQFKNEYARLSELIDTPYAEEDNSSMRQRKQDLQTQLNDLNKQYGTKEQRERQLQRIKTLQDQESTMAQQLADLEATEFTIQAFTKVKMDILESRINSRFSIAKFKMFDRQINGGEVEDCITLINGVPYPDANTAAKIQCGLDIINTLSAHYNIYAPVWVDNRESVTDLPETSSQIINLIVSPLDKKLRVTSKDAELVEA